VKLTPLDVRKQEFRKTLRGFDPIEVQTFLEMVAEEYEQVLEENKKLNRSLIELETKLKDFQETEKNLRETLLNVQEVKKQSEESSRRQADLIIKESELKALEIVEKARQQARLMRDEVNTLRTQKESFINRLRQILISQIELLSVLEVDDAIPEEAYEFLENVKAMKKKKIKMKNPESEENNFILPDEDKEVQEDQNPPAKVGNKTEAIHGKTQEEESFTISADFIETEENISDKVNQEKKTGEGEGEKPKKLEDEDINEFFKKGIHIDELIKNLDKKQSKT
jgi:cell division initiation protein